MEEITTRYGLLYRGKKARKLDYIPLPEADRVAEEHGFWCAERMVEHLQKEQRKKKNDNKHSSNINNDNSN